MAKENKIDIHDYDRQLERLLKRIKTNKKISEANKKTILKFRDRLLADNLSKARVIYYLGRLLIITEWIKKDLNKVVREDIEGVLRNVNQMSVTCRARSYNAL